MSDHWIQKAVSKHPGALRRQLGAKRESPYLRGNWNMPPTKKAKQVPAQGWP